MTLIDKYIRYANVARLTILTHLYTGYARITQGDLEENTRLLKKGFDFNKPIEELFDHIHDAIDYTVDGSTPRLCKPSSLYNECRMRDYDKTLAPRPTDFPDGDGINTTRW